MHECRKGRSCGRAPFNDTADLAASHRLFNPVQRWPSRLLPCGQVASRLPQSLRDTRQISWGNLSRLPCTVAGSTLRTLDGYGLRGKLSARPALTPNIRFLSIDSHI